ncbi:Hypothetical protein FKW44_021721 [Caligus rogercresseyi]|uniref:Uncharacterized protein n=1 Tax=Caligus rogercresseyi TaxID=217165 RepID=A0A7T8GRR5_CALRO|nr:Hypothetical protein FKW44_021721 [Caligus rogercresseyi]
MTRLMNEDLGLKTLAKVQLQQLTHLQRDKRLNKLYERPREKCLGFYTRKTSN